VDEKRDLKRRVGEKTKARGMGRKEESKFQCKAEKGRRFPHLERTKKRAEEPCLNHGCPWEKKSCPSPNSEEYR